MSLDAPAPPECVDLHAGFENAGAAVALRDLDDELIDLAPVKARAIRDTLVRTPHRRAIACSKTQMDH